MKFKLNSLFYGSLCAVLFLLYAAQGLLAQGKVKGVNIVMIDPGHGGKDPGAVHVDPKTKKETREKDINLAVSLLLGDMIKKNLPDVKVLYTRDKDVFIDLYKRGEKANKAAADLFISIHVNSVAKGRLAPSGALTLVMGQDKADANLDIAMRENDVITYEDDYNTKYEGYIPGSTESFIIFSLMQYANQDQSMSFASILQKHYKKSTPMPDLGARQQNLLVLWKTAMPAVLTELGFITNERDRRTLSSDKGRKSIAAALFNAFSEYKAKVEGNSCPVLIETYDISEDLQDESQSQAQTVSNGPAGEKSTTVSSSAKVTYRVQICSVPKKLSKNESLLRKYKGKDITELRFGKIYKYYVGSCATYSEASKLLAEIRKTTKDAFLVAFEGDKLISLTEARRKTK